MQAKHAAKNCVTKAIPIKQALFTCQSCNRPITQEARWDIHTKCKHITITSTHLKPFISDICTSCKTQFQQDNDTLHAFIRREQRKQIIAQETQQTQLQQAYNQRNPHPREGCFYFMAEVQFDDNTTDVNKTISLVVYNDCNESHLRIPSTDQSINRYLQAHDYDASEVIINRITPLTPYQKQPNVDLADFIQAFLEDYHVKLCNNNSKEGVVSSNNNNNNKKRKQ